MELNRLRTLAGLNESSDERKAPANLTVKPTGKDPMSVKHAAGADPRNAAPANLTVRKGGKSVKEEQEGLIEAILTTIQNLDLDALKQVASAIIKESNSGFAAVKKQFATEIKALKNSSDAVVLGRKIKAWVAANKLQFTEADRSALADYMNEQY